VETAGAGALNDAHNAMITLSTGHASMHVQLQSVPQDGVGLTDATDALERLTVGERVGEGGATTASESSRDDDDRESVTASLDGLGDSDGVGVGVTEGVLDGDATVPLMDSANRKPAVVEAELWTSTATTLGPTTNMDVSDTAIVFTAVCAAPTAPVAASVDLVMTPAGMFDRATSTPFMYTTAPSSRTRYIASALYREAVTNVNRV
jgi:hypothetical protein